MARLLLDWTVRILESSAVNRCYRLLWNRLRQCLVLAAEIARGRHRAGRGRRASVTRRHACWLAGALALAPLAATAGQIPPTAAPTGGQVSAGQGSIRQDRLTTTIDQRSEHLALGWQSFDVGADHTVTFVQPNAQAIAVNRIADPHGSTILGRIQANGQVFLLNPNGVLFGSSAQVNVGGLVASTLDLDDNQLASGVRRFAGQDRGSVVNQGTLHAAPGGYVALIGPQVTNRGTLAAPGGTVAMGGGDAVTLSFDADRLLSLQVERSTLDALADNRQLIQADGGQVLMSAGAKDAVLASVVNNSGVIEARTVANQGGRIVLLGGMATGTTQVAGTLDASAPAGGDGGFIETSAARVKIADEAMISTLAANGKTGSWLIDPQDYTLAASGGDMSGAALSSSLATTDVAIQSASGAAAGSGNIEVNDAVSWSTDTTLTLTASNDVAINANLTATGTNAGLVLEPNTANGADAASGSGQYRLANGAMITLSGANPRLSIAGQSYTVINRLGTASSMSGSDLQGMRGNLAGNYALGSDLDASATSTWRNGQGLNVIGTGAAPFLGNFDGLGHTISGLTGANFFGNTAAGSAIRNLGLLARNAAGASNTAGLVSTNNGIIDQAYVIGAVNGNDYVGGLAAYNYGAISRSYTSGTVNGKSNVGGLVAVNSRDSATIAQSYSTAAVNGSNNVGGLIGLSNGRTTGAYATGAVSGNINVGGLVGVDQGAGVTQSWASGLVTGTTYVGGLIGAAWSMTTNSYWDSYSSGRSTSIGTGNSANLAAIKAVTSDPAQSGAANYAFKQSAYPQLDFTAGNGGWLVIGGGTRPFLQAEYSTRIANAHQLQLAATNLGASYTLAGDIDASETARAIGGTAPASTSGMWNSAGFSPLGTASNPFTGSLDGAGYTVTGLGINRPLTNNVGLLGFVAAGSTIRRIGLVGGAVVGGTATGSLAGTNIGTISQAYTSTSVTGTGSYTGGLVGSNTTTLVSGSPVPGTIVQGYATGAVNGGNYVGGLVGISNGSVISQAYATGAVNGTKLVGGLVGSVQAANFSAPTLQVFSQVSQTWASGAVTGTENIGGLAGYGNPDMISSSYWDTYSSGLATSAGTSNPAGIVAVTSDPAQAGAANYAFKQGAYAKLDFGAGWFMLEGSTRPFLQAEYSTRVGNAHQLQLLAMNLAATYSLANDIDASESARAVDSAAAADASGMWSGGGFSPLGSAASPFSGSLDGQRHMIDNLAINRPADSAVGLFGSLQSGSSVSDVGLRDVAISGAVSTGSLAGESKGTIARSFATGTVEGTAHTGGLVGNNLGTLSQSYAAAGVTGTDAVGGLVGYNAATINQAYATGPSAGGNWVGGLVGYNAGTVSQAYATGLVGGTGNAGGLSGYNTGSIGSSYWNQESSGQATSAGGTGLGSAQMLDPASYAGWDLATAGGSTKAWRIYTGQTAPLLRNFMTGLAVTVSAVSTTYNGTAFGGSSAYTLGTLTPTGWLPLAKVDPSLVSGLVNTAPPAIDAGSYALNAGLYSTQMGYDLTLGNAKLTIAPAPLAVTGATAASKTYDGSTTAGITGAILSGTVYGSDTVTLANASSGQFADKNVGTGKSVTVAATLTGAGAGNYQLTQPTGLTADITPADLSISGITAADKVYDGSTAATLGYGSIAFTGKVGGDVLSVGGASGAFDTKDVGNGKTVSITGITLGGADAGNYTLLDHTASVTAAITPATLTYTAAARSTTYGTPVAALTGTLTGFVGTDTQATATTGTLAWTSPATATSNVGNYAIGGSGLSAANYVFAQAPGNATALTIDPAPLGIGTLDVSKVYDGTTTAAGTAIAVTGSLFGTDSLSGGTFTFDTRDVGTGKTVTVAGVTVEDGNGGANYAVTYVPNTHSRITARPVVLAPIASVSGITAADKVYDGSTTATLDFAGAVFNGMASGDHLAVAGARGAFDDKNAGTAKTVYISGITLGGGDAANYTLLDTTATTTADILPLGIGVQASGRNKVYDGTTAAMLDAAATNVLAGDQVQLSATGHFADSAVGTAKPVTVDAVTATGADAGNYRLTHNAGTTADITPATLTYVATPRGATSGWVPMDLGGTVTGLVGGDTLATATTGTLTWSTPATAASPGGHYPILGGGLAAANYVFRQAPGNAEALSLGTGTTFATPTPQGLAVIVAQLQQASPLATTSALAGDDTWSPAPDSSARGTVHGLPAPNLRIVDGGVRIP